MIAAIGLAISIAIPLLAGLPWLLLLGRDAPAAAGRWGIAVGYGYAAGLLLIITGMQTAALLNLPVGFWAASIVPIVVGGIGWIRFGGGIAALARADLGTARDSWKQMPKATRLVCAIALGVIALRIGTLALESVVRPIFPWEAVSGVAAKARVWFESARLVPFVAPSAMLDLAGVYTNADPGGLSLPSLLMVWTASAINGWHEGAVGFAWWGLGVALVCAFYGHLRKAGCGVAYSLVVTYALISLPLVDAHIALGGAPQWIGAAGIGLAGSAFMRWLDTRSNEALFCSAVGAILAAGSLASTWPWLGVFALAAVMTFVPRFSRKLAIGIPIASVIGLLALMQTPVKIGSASLRVQLSPDWAEAPESLLLLDNWHLLFGVLLLVVLAGWRRIFTPTWLVRTWVIGMGLGLMIVKGALSLPPWWFGGLRDFSYVGLQLAPMLLLWMAWSARDTALARVRGATASSVAPQAADISARTEISG